MQPVWYNLMLTLLFVGAGALGIWFLKWKKDWPLLDRVLAAPLAAGFVVLLGVCASNVLLAPFFGFNAARLAPTFALVKGYRLYYPTDSGPALSTIYGPVTALTYLPTTLMRTPTDALVFGSVLSATLFFAPMIWLTVRRGWGNTPQQITLLAALLCFGLQTMWMYPLKYGAFCIHADAPALGFGGLACVALYLRKRDDEWAMLSVSAVLAVLSVWSKQSMGLLPVSLAASVFLLFGVASFKRYVLLLCSVGLTVSAAFFLSLGPSEVFFNLFQGPSHPSHHTWQGDKTEWLWRASGELVAESQLPLAVLGIGLLVRCAGWIGSAEPLDWRHGMLKSRWMIFVLIGLVNAPAAVMNRVWVGGDRNVLNLSLYFWLMGALLLLAEAATAETTEEKGVSQVAKAVLAVLLVGLLGGVPARLQNLYQIAKGFRSNQQEAACQILRDTPGAVYFPNDPLAHLMTDGKLYHFSFGLIDRRLGGRPVTEKHFRANIPPAARAVVFGYLWPEQETQTHEETMRYLPEFTSRGRDQSGWMVYARTN